MTKRFWLLLALSLVVAEHPAYPSLADTAAAGQAVPTATSGQTAAPPVKGAGADAGTPTPSSRSLQTGVRKVELSLEKLRDVGLDLKQLQKSASTLYDEVAIRPVQLVTEPEVIGTSVIMLPIGVQPTGPMQPPRKERLDLSMSSLRPIVALLKTNADDFLSGEQQLDLPGNAAEELKPKFKDWVDRVNELVVMEKQLEGLTQGPNYDNNAIAQVSTSMQKSIKKLDGTRRDIYKVIRKQGKKLGNE